MGNNTYEDLYLTVAEVFKTFPNKELTVEDVLALSNTTHSHERVTAVLGTLFKASYRRIQHKYQMGSASARAIDAMGEGVFYRTNMGSYVFDTDARIWKKGLAKNKFQMYLDRGAVIIPPALHVPGAVEEANEKAEEALGVPFPKVPDLETLLEGVNVSGFDKNQNREAADDFANQTYHFTNLPRIYIEGTRLLIETETEFITATVITQFSKEGRVL